MHSTDPLRHHVAQALYCADNLFAVAVTKGVTKFLESDRNRRRTHELASPNGLFDFFLANNRSSAREQKVEHIPRLAFQRHDEATLAELMLPLMRLKFRKRQILEDMNPMDLRK